MLDWSFTYKDHIANTKAKIGSRNNILKKLANTKLSAHASIICTTAFATP